MKLFFSLLILVFATALQGQCSYVANCEDAPTVCDITELNGFVSCTAPYDGNILGVLCTAFVLNNPSYLEFVAGEESITFEIIPSDCFLGSGIQAVITDPCDPSVCYDDGQGNCFAETFSITASNLVVGNVYQLIVDGCAGDECAWTVNITSQALTLEVEEVDQEFSAVCDSIDLEFCAGSEISFYPAEFANSSIFMCWSIDNDLGVTAVSNADNCTASDTLGIFTCSHDFSSCGALKLKFEDAGTYQLCLMELKNECNDYMPMNFCYEITIQALIIQDFGFNSICEAEFPFLVDIEGPDGAVWANNDIPLGPGAYFQLIEDECGCSVAQILELMSIPLDSFYIDADMDGFGDDATLILDCVMPPGVTTIGGDCDDFDAAINPDAIEIPNNDFDENCDGIVEITNATTLTEKTSIQFYPNPVAEVLFVESDKNFVYGYTLCNFEGRLLQSGTLENQDSIDLSHLAAGIYLLAIMDIDSNIVGWQRIVKL